MSATTVLIDYGSGNIASAAKALSRAANGTGEILVTADPKEIACADRIVLPGVGAFADCMNGLSSIPGMIEALTEKVMVKGAPFLGICVGMQLMATVGREFGDHKGLGWIEGEVVKLTPAPFPEDGPALKIPHMGWNELITMRPHPIFEGIGYGAQVYFVHSYELMASADVIAMTDYGGAVTAAVGRANIVGTQFHPEKSQAVGLTVLGNFLRWKP